MKKFLAIFILCLCFTTSSQADDISDFQIDGISIGDSLLDYFDKKKINSRKKTFYNDDNFYKINFNSNKSIYKLINFHLKKNDNKFIVYSMGGRNSYAWASQNSHKLASLTIVDTGPDTQSVGRRRMQQFKSLPDELDSFEEFAARIQSYTGRPIEQVLGSLKYNIRERSDGKWSWKYDKVMRQPDYQSQTIPSSELWEMITHINCPTLIIRGANSDVFNSDTMDKMRNTIADCIISTVDNAGHLVQGDNPVGFLQEYQHFLNTISK